MFTRLRGVGLRAALTSLTALRALQRNKLRSSLTALGIIIGVFAVVAMVALGNGARAQIESQVAGLGQNMLMVFAGSTRSGGVRGGMGSAAAITLEDAEALRREIPDVAASSPEVTTTAQAIANGRNW
ncbi:MAG TPA: ABC transporter permease, partial [Steroidobacteraceae bacterium]|nr:ABC transporter permease [Steroidobacteraceae bacterium]